MEEIFEFGYADARSVVFRAHDGWEPSCDDLTSARRAMHHLAELGFVQPRREPAIGAERADRMLLIATLRFNAKQTLPRPTSCPNGHRYTDENTDVDARGYSHCRTCARDKYRRYRARKKAAG
jgi:hypothetical protein